MPVIKLLDRDREGLRLKHYSYHTEQTSRFSRFSCLPCCFWPQRPSPDAPRCGRRTRAPACTPFPPAGAYLPGGKDCGGAACTSGDPAGDFPTPGLSFEGSAVPFREVYLQV